MSGKQGNLRTWLESYTVTADRFYPAVSGELIPWQVVDAM
jgi:hypothetical protein